MKGKKIIIGITGGIAAYKACELASLLVKQEADVHVVMTEKAKEFIAPLTFQALTGKPVWEDEFSGNFGLTIPHVQLSEEADLLAIVPATANTIAKIVHGIADNLLSSIALAHNKKLLLAPAMNSNMYLHPAVQANLKTLESRGVKIVEPGSGRLACGVIGPGRLAEVDLILAEINNLLFEHKTLLGKKVLVTAGGTLEPIDPVRYIGNRSSGKMGFALAKVAKLRGADVVLISGPNNLKPFPGIQYHQVETTLEMQELVLRHFTDAHIVVKAAAVADYKVASPEQQKIKKQEDTLELLLTKNPDILKGLGENKTRQILVGFAAETKDLLANAQEKINNKNLDLIVANDVTRKDAGFNVNTNLVTLLFPDGGFEEIPLMSKEDLAHRIFEVIEGLPRFELSADIAKDKECD